MAEGISLQLRLQDDDGAGAGDEIAVPVEALVIAGWTGRDAAAVEAHIAELEAIGVPRPATVPCFYRVAAALLPPADTIQVPGTDSSGEVEFVLFGSRDGMLIGLGSDHTDRRVESYSITVSKQMCAKPVAPDVWRFADVVNHFDMLILRSWALDSGVRRLYQEGEVSAMRPPAELVGLYLDNGVTLPHGTTMFCGTLAVEGDIAPAGRFEFELEAPVLGRTIRHGYNVATLPVTG